MLPRTLVSGPPQPPVPLANDQHRRHDSYVAYARSMPYPLSIDDEIHPAYMRFLNDTGGHQRERDRQKAAQKQSAGAKGKKESATSLQQRREKDATALREKMKRKEEQAAVLSVGVGGRGEIHV
ncbi:hypothetical protein C8Q80DRAFT_286303 [Daedaleopsis nitida]|nr:hypothetical protein C8Q80DRAFT_286303 [Daedaleopsis nitida]